MSEMYFAGPFTVWDGVPYARWRSAWLAAWAEIGWHARVDLLLDRATRSTSYILTNPFLGLP